MRELIEQQVTDGTLVIREMTPEERERYPALPREKKRGPGRPRKDFSLDERWGR